MQKLGRCIETHTTGEIFKVEPTAQHGMRYFAWKTGAGAGILHLSLRNARNELGVAPTRSEKAMRAAGERAAAEEARKAYISNRNRTHKGR